MQKLISGILILFATFIVGCNPVAGPRAEVASVTDAEFSQIVLESDKPVLVDFWAPWCGPCVQLGPVVEEVAAAYEGKVTVVKMNIDDEAEMAVKYEVDSIPALFVFKDGEVVEQMIGVQSKSKISAMLDNALDN